MSNYPLDQHTRSRLERMSRSGEHAFRLTTAIGATRQEFCSGNPARITIAGNHPPCHHMRTGGRTCTDTIEIGIERSRGEIRTFPAPIEINIGFDVRHSFIEAWPFIVAAGHADSEHPAIMPAVLDDRMSWPQCHAGQLRVVANPLLPWREPAAAEFEEFVACGKRPGQSAAAASVACLQDDDLSPDLGECRSCCRAGEPGSHHRNVINIHCGAVSGAIDISAALPPDAVMSMEQTRSV